MEKGESWKGCLEWKPTGKKQESLMMRACLWLAALGLVLPGGRGNVHLFWWGPKLSLSCQGFFCWVCD